MQKELALILRNRAKTVPFIDLLAGLVQPLSTRVPVGETTSFITEKEPVSYDVRGSECEGKQISMVPNSHRKSVIYFEDRTGLQAGDDEGSYRCTLRLVCWMNKVNLVGDPYANITGRCIAALNAAICRDHTKKAGIFQDLTVTFAGSPPQDAGIFSRYTYRETDQQYLRPPFEFFAIDYLCTFSVNPACIGEIDWNIKVCG